MKLGNMIHTTSYFYLESDTTNGEILFTLDGTGYIGNMCILNITTHNAYGAYIGNNGDITCEGVVPSGYYLLVGAFSVQ